MLPHLTPSVFYSQLGQQQFFQNVIHILLLLGVKSSNNSMYKQHMMWLSQHNLATVMTDLPFTCLLLFLFTLTRCTIPLKVSQKLLTFLHLALPLTCNVLLLNIQEAIAFTFALPSLTQWVLPWPYFNLNRPSPWKYFHPFILVFKNSNYQF